jgi:ABC-type lipoprotein release transport system permease subunit
VFDAGGSAFETEIWADLGELASQFRREGIYNSVVLRTPTPPAAEELAQRLADSRKLQVNAQTEIAYYKKQAEQTELIRTASLVIAAFMGIGAVFGITNTMFAAIGQRIKDIAVMRIIGFTRREILVCFLMEALLIAAFGGICGAALGYAINGVTVNSGLGAKSLAFAFKVDRQALLTGAAFTAAMGLIGGILPALSAMRVRPLESLR